MSPQFTKVKFNHVNACAIAYKWCQRTGVKTTWNMYTWPKVEIQIRSAQFEYIRSKYALKWQVKVQSEVGVMI